jgi:membrane associated rhomboid family serine protease
MCRPHYSYNGEQPQGGWSSFGFGGGMTRTVRLFLIINVAAFIFLKLSQPFLDLYPIFGLVPRFVLTRLLIWQPVTYLFVHTGWWGLLWACLILWMFGCELERAWGSRAFLWYYLSAGVFGGFCGVLTGLIQSGVEQAVYGAWPAILALIVGYGLTFPERVVTMLLFFVLPIRLKAKHLAMVSALITFLIVVQSASEGGLVPHVASLSAMAGGYLYLRRGDRVTIYFKRLRARRAEARLRKRADRKIQAEKTVTEDIDSILEKISKYGIDSLTSEERQTLEKARSKMMGTDEQS